MNRTVELVAFTVRLAKDEHERLVALATAEHRSLGAEARTAIVTHLKAAEEKQAA